MWTNKRAKFELCWLSWSAPFALKRWSRWQKYWGKWQEQLSPSARLVRGQNWLSAHPILWGEQQEHSLANHSSRQKHALAARPSRQENALATFPTDQALAGRAARAFFPCLLYLYRAKGALWESRRSANFNRFFSHTNLLSFKAFSSVVTSQDLSFNMAGLNLVTQSL